MSVSPLQQLTEQLVRYNEANLPPDLLDSLKIIATKTSNLISQTAGEFLHKLDNTKHSEEQVLTVINTFPKALSHASERTNGRLPIQSAATCRIDKSLSFIPLLAREGTRRNVGGEGKRGGLLTSILNGNNDQRNVIQLLANVSKTKDKNGSDLMCLQVLQSLKSMDLLRKDDVRKFELLHYSNNPCAKARFEFFARWAPESLKRAGGKFGPPLIHTVMQNSDDEKAKGRFESVFQTNMKLFPDEFGLLFLKYGGISTCEAAMNRFGRNDAMKIFRKYIPPSDNRPILHYVVQHVPHLMDIFTRYYFNATYLRDTDNRTLFLASLASGNKSFMFNASFFSMATDDQVSEKDPVTDLFPFALAASDNTSDLDAVYLLLRRAPGLIIDGKKFIGNGDNVPHHDGNKTKNGSRKRKRHQS